MLKKIGQVILLLACFLCLAKPAQAQSEPEITLRYEGLTTTGKLLLEFSFVDSSGTIPYRWWYRIKDGNPQKLTINWSKLSDGSFYGSTQIPFKTERLWAKPNLFWKTGGSASWLGRWDENGQYGLTRRFIYLEFKPENILRLVTNFAVPTAIETGDNRWLWVNWSPLVEGEIWFGNLNVNFKKFKVLTDGYPLITLDPNIVITQQGWYYVPQPATPSGSIPGKLPGKFLSK